MPEIHYKTLDAYLKKSQGEYFFPVYLIFGEEALFKSAFNTLLDAILPPSERGFNYDPMDGSNDALDTVIERMNTFSLLSGTKVIAFLEARIFYSKENHAKLLEKSKERFLNNDRKGAAKFFTNALSRLHLSFDEFGNADKSQIVAPDVLGDGKWLDELNRYCEGHDLHVPVAGDQSERLEKAIHKGFPKGNHLIITTDFVDKRRKLFKTIQQAGLVIDCSVPKGDRRNDRVIQEDVLRGETEGILSKSGKSIDKEAFLAAMEMTGFEIRTFCHNMEKLVDYIGERKKITVEDVERVLKRTKLDPVYELTNAIGERRLQDSLFFLDSLLAGHYHPLQVLSAVTNQMRRLLTAKDFLESDWGDSWYPNMTFSQFRSHVLPRIKDYDQSLMDQLTAWDDGLHSDSDDEAKPSKKSRKRATTDLLLGRSTGSPYPVFQILRQSDTYAVHEIVEAFHHLHDADVKLKSTGQNAKLVLESVLFKICGNVEDMKIVQA